MTEAGATAAPADAAPRAPADSRAPSSPDNPWPVRTVAQKVAQWIARLGEVWVDGEIAQLQRRAGTAYLTLRDPAANMSLEVTCNIDVVDRQEVPLQQGARVIVRARPDFYIARGRFSLRATDIRQVGLGELLARVERLRRLLEAEGLFRPERKRPLPFLPRRIGLVTGRASAAEHDVLSNATRRWPGVSIQVENCAVQGRNAAAEVIEAMHRLAKDPEIEVIIIARGGGSVEDLLPFSDEGLCRAVYALRTPVVSAIGHEPDAPLLDYVADLRASTPTDAAKRVVPDVAEETALVRTARTRARSAVLRLLDRETASLRTTRSRPCLADRYQVVDRRADEVTRLRTGARRYTGHRVELATVELTQLRGKVAALSPQSTLERGYAVLQTAAGAVVRHPDEVAEDDRLIARVAGGPLTVRVTSSDPTDGGVR